MPEIGDTRADTGWLSCTPPQDAWDVDPDITTLYIPSVHMDAWAVSPASGVEGWCASGHDVVNSVTDISISVTPPQGRAYSWGDNTPRHCEI